MYSLCNSITLFCFVFFSFNLWQKCKNLCGGFHIYFNPITPNPQRLTKRSQKQEGALSQLNTHTRTHPYTHLQWNLSVLYVFACFASWNLCRGQQLGQGRSSAQVPFPSMSGAWCCHDFQPACKRASLTKHIPARGRIHTFTPLLKQPWVALYHMLACMCSSSLPLGEVLHSSWNY